MYSNAELKSKFLFDSQGRELRCSTMTAAAYLSCVNRFLSALAVAIYVSCGAPPRATELCTVKFANTAQRQRDLVLAHGGLSLQLGYAKPDNIRGFSRVSRRARAGSLRSSRPPADLFRSGRISFRSRSAL